MLAACRALRFPLTPFNVLPMQIQVCIEEVKAVRAALARQQAQEVPEDERWAVQVRGSPLGSLVCGAADLLCHSASSLMPCALPPAPAPSAPHLLMLPRPHPCPRPCERQGTAARRYWSCPGNADLRVRGKNYLTVGGALEFFLRLVGILQRLGGALRHG